MIRTSYLTLFIALLTFLPGCGKYYESMSSGYVGCPSNEVVVGELTYNGNVTNWTATCRGRFFNCTLLTKSNLPDTVACKEEIQVAANPLPSASPSPTVP